MMPNHDIDAALRRALRSGAGAVSGCDPELTAAYAEGRLRGAERQKLQAHLAECESCRRLCTALLEENVEVEPPARVRQRWRWRWAIPAMAGVAIVGSVVYYQRDRPIPKIEPATQTRAVAEYSAAPLRQEPKPQARANLAKKGRIAREALRDEISQPAAPVVPSTVSAPPSPAAEPLRQEETAAGAIERREADQQRLKPLQLVTGTSDYARAAKAAIAPSPLPDGAVLRGSIQHGGRQWAVSDGGRIFRSNDGGRTWEKVESPTSADLVRVTWDPATDLLVVEDKEGNRYQVKP